jgi:hypothetical protein
MHQVENEHSAMMSCGQKCCLLSQEDVELYRISFVFVLQELERLYADIVHTRYCLFT